MARGRPVTLRDFLELGCDSSSDGFGSFPQPARRSVDSSSDDLRPWSPTAFFLPKSPGALARISSLSRSFSRRITFWRRREDDDEDLFYFDDRDSCGFPSPLVSSCSVSECAESETDIIVIEETPVASSSTSAPGAAGDGQTKALDGDPAVGHNLEMEDKQQLSPVSVLDFPFDDDDGDEEQSDAGTCSPSCFQHHNCADNLQRSKNAQLLHKIRRFDDGPTEAVDPVDLDAQFTTSESGESIDDAHGRCAHLANNSCTDDSEATPFPSHDVGEEHQSVERSECQQEPDVDEYRLLTRLLDDTRCVSTAAVDEVSEWLLLDFFAGGIERLRSVAGSVVGTLKPVDDGKVRELLEAAGEWLRGAGPQWGVGDVMFSGASALADMERSRPWMCVREEEQDVGAEVEGIVMDGLVDELVTDLAPFLVQRQMMELGTVS